MVTMKETNIEAELLEAARKEYLIMCSTRSRDCNINACKTCGWGAFDEEGWKEVIKEQIKKQDGSNENS